MKKNGMRGCLRIVFLLICLLPVQAMAFEAGPVTVGGDIRANYTIGDYEKDGTDAPQFGVNGFDDWDRCFNINFGYYF